MDYSTRKEILIATQVFQMLIGVVTLMIGNQPQLLADLTKVPTKSSGYL